MKYTKFEVLEKLEEKLNSILSRINIGLSYGIISDMFLLFFMIIKYEHIIMFYIFIINTIFVILFVYLRYKSYKKLDFLFDIINYYCDDDDDGSGIGINRYCEVH